MAAINSVQKSLHLPLSGLASPRVLMCSASVGSEGSVTLQLRDANSTDSTQSAVSTTSLDNALTIGYPDPEMLADVLGTLQTACNSLKNNSNSSNSSSNTSSNIHNIYNNNNHSANANRITITSKKLIVKENTPQAKISTTTTETVSTSTSTTNRSNNKTCSINNCLISRSNSNSSNNSNSSSSNIHLANVQAMSCSSAASIISNSNSNNNNNNSNSNINIINNSSNNNTINNCSSSNSNSSNSSNSNSNFSNSNSNDSLLINNNCNNNNSNINKISSSSSNSGNCSSSNSSNNKNVPGSNPPSIVKKSRPKLSSPTRHGPQQCQVCSKVFGNASALAKHKLTHSDERKYVCAMCSKAFKRQDHLNGHMMTHRNKKPYECKAEGCGKSYCDARSLRRHTENHHAVAAAAAAATPQNQTLSPSTGTPIGLSLSPATASGDASSPDGATCIRTYITAAGSVVDAQTGVLLSEEQIKSINVKGGVTVLSPTASNSSSSAVSIASPISITESSLEGGEGLTRQQLDLISQIMQQTKQSSAQVTVSTATNVNSYKIDTATSTNTQSTTVQQIHNSTLNRPRTWNMQTQLNSTQKVSIAMDNATASNAATLVSTIDDKELDLNQQLVAAINPHLLNIVKIDQKPVECNLCHRKFKNIPALNGHMRLHGGYFKKDPEAKKTERKDTTGPPLQTASIGVRALIEEKIISKRSKDLNKGAFAVPAPPSNVATNTIRRSTSDLENFLTPKTHSSSTGGGSNAITQQQQQQQQQMSLPAVTTIKNSSLSIQQIGLPQSIEIFSTKQQKTTSNISIGVGTTSNSIAIIPSSNTLSNSAIQQTTTTKSTSTDPKDSTLIELLKRGTRVAVATKRTSNSTNNLITATETSAATSHHIIANNRAVVIPSELQILAAKPSANNSGSTARISTAGSTNPVGISLSDTTPLSLTISQTTGSSGDIYTLTYSTDSSGLFDETEVYNVSDTEMLLQTVDSIELLNDAADHTQSEHSDRYTLAASTTNATNTTPAVQSVESVVATAASTLSDSLLEYQTFHSKELIMSNSTNSNCNQNQHDQLHLPQIVSIRANNLTLPAEIKQHGALAVAGSMTSPMHSPLAYPTPPASHENVTQSSPFVDEAQHFVESANAFFNEKCQTDFLKDASEADFFKSSSDGAVSQFTDNEKILKLKSVLEDNAFDTPIKVEDLLSGSDDTECDLREFAEQNLSFLDDDQEFLDDSGNATSPLSESFFTSGLGTAEEVKEVLREVLPDDSINGETQSENVIDLYYLPGIGLQSQMMPNSEDPLLSSSPRDFGHQRGQQQQQQLLQMQQLQMQQQLYTQQLLQQNQHQQQQQQQLQQDLKTTLIQPTQQTQNTLIQPNNSEFSMLLTTTTAANANQSNTQMQYTERQLTQNQQFVTATSSSNSTNALGTLSSTQYKDLVNEAMQPIIYTGSTDKEEIAINQPLQPNLAIVTEGNEQNDDTSLYFNNNSIGAITLSATTITTNAPSAITEIKTESMIPTSSILNQSNSILKRRLRANDSTDSSHFSTYNYSKYHALSPYRSKLRKPTRTHYTPAPMLNPDRKGVGLYCNIRKSFVPGAISFDTIDDDFDDPVGLVDFSDDLKVNLGSAYQAQLPVCEIRHEGIERYSNVGEELMWQPNVQQDEKLLMRYIELSKSSAVPLGYHSEEVALKALLQAEGNTHSAVLTLLQSQSNSFHLKWTANELELFLQGLEKYGKDFSTIANEIISKSTGECVQMYYFWKKLSVDYKVTHLKKEKLNGNTTTSVLGQQQISELRPHVCEMPDCSASFTSKAALHGHTRIHCYGRNTNNSATAAASTSTNSTLASGNAQQPGQAISKEDFPCKVCGKVFNKVKSRSAHMKTHRIQDSGDATATAAQQQQVQPQSQLQIQLQQQQQQQQQLQEAQ